MHLYSCDHKHHQQQHGDCDHYYYDGFYYTMANKGIINRHDSDVNNNELLIYCALQLNNNTKNIERVCITYSQQRTKTVDDNEGTYKGMHKRT